MMKFYSEISNILKSSLSNDSGRLQAYIELFITKLESEGYHRESEGLKRLHEKHSPFQEQSALSRPVPVESDSRLQLADKTFPKQHQSKIFLPLEQERVIDSFLNYLKSRDKLLLANVPLNPSLLLWGEPGTGKSKLATYLASSLELPLITARADALISSYLGATSKNIRALLDYAQNEPCVLFLDEFDAIAKARDDKNEIGELKRVVVSLLQNIDSLGDTILVAATNHIHLLDPAIGRRFHYKLHLGLPAFEEREKIINNLLSGRDFPICSVDFLTEISEGMTGAEIESAVYEFFRKCIVDENQDEYEIAREILSNRFQWLDFELKSKNENIRKLKEVNSSVFTGRVLGKLWKISPSYVSKINKGG